MIVSQLMAEVRLVRSALSRNYGVSSVILQKASDPIQQLFVDKIREYSKKSKELGGKLVDATPETDRQLTQELERVAEQFGGKKGASEMTKFPSFNFGEPKIDPGV